MTRAEKVAEAMRLREGGLTYREIGERLGVAISTAHEFVDDPDLSKASERKRKCAHTTGRGVCTKCGEPMGVNSKWQGASRCRDCQVADFKEERDRKAAEIERLWAIGCSIKQIAETCGYTPGSIGVQITRLRRMGYDLPYRRRSGKKFPDQVAA